MKSMWHTAVAVLLLALANPTWAQTQLRLLGAETTGIAFANTLTEGPELNYFNYTYAYHGGGVAVGDVNNDGLPDIYLTSNQQPNRLYLNRGNLRFEDVTTQAGVMGTKRWTTGTTMVDVNADGWLDIYVCLSGMDEEPRKRENLLYVNNHDGTFTERAKEYGINCNGHSTMAYFADLDHDGDLDLYVVNHRVDWSMNTKVIVDPAFVPNAYETDRLYLNNGNGTFTDATQQAGVTNKCWGLGAAIGDMDGDGLNDIYVANDFLEPDLLYVNKGNGTFAQRNQQLLRHMSFFGMGVDRADFNNDGLPDLCVLDMTPPDHSRSKQNMASMRPDQFYTMVKVGWHHQYMTNTLQMNNGNGSYSEVAHLAGIDRTDWSWAPLFVDVDNDGLKDLFVTNGIRRDVTNNDFKVRVRELVQQKGQELDFATVMDMIPRTITDNLIYRNKGDIAFEKANDAWNYHHAATSNGAAFADLDADGDMDLITNNLDAPASIIENVSTGTRYLQLMLEGDAANPFAIGSKATLYTNKGQQYLELWLARGFQSSVEPLLHFGLGTATVDSVVIKWPDGTFTHLNGPMENVRLKVKKADAQKRQRPEAKAPWLTEVAAVRGLNYTHVESSFNDFATEKLLPQQQSMHGPALAVADVNGDGLDDVFVGAAAGRNPALFVQNASGNFAESTEKPWQRNAACEEIGAHFFDADDDGDQDLYVASGSTEFPMADARYKDHLYLNDGKGNFAETEGALPNSRFSTMVVRSADIDNDGDLDLFVGGRNVPGAYPKSANSSVLLNDNGRFKDVTAIWNASIATLGMVTDAVFADLDNNEMTDLVVACEWQAVRFFRNTGTALQEVTETMGNPNDKGWWYSLAVNDLDNDGDLDIVAGNLGLNNKFHPSQAKPLELYMTDFDTNGTNDIVLAKHSSTECLPVRGRECSSDQMPFITQKFPTYEQFANANLETIYGSERLDGSFHVQATEFASVIYENRNGKFAKHALPRMAQISAINGIAIADMNHDGTKDLIVVGNLYGAEVETTRYDASIGLVLLGDGQLNFEPVSVLQSGLFAPYDAKHLSTVRLAGGKIGYVVANNSAPVQLFVAE